MLPAPCRSVLCGITLFPINTDIDFLRFGPTLCARRRRGRENTLLLIVPWPNARSYIERPCPTVVITFRLVFLSRRSLPPPANRKHPTRTERNARRYRCDRDDHYTYILYRRCAAPARHPPTHFVADGRRSLFVHTSTTHNIRATTEQAIITAIVYIV